MLKSLSGRPLGLLLLLVSLTGCSSPEVKEPPFPASLPPSWTRGAVQPLGSAQFPPIVRAAGLDHAWQTEYRGAGNAVAKVEAYALRNSAQGLDLVQRWKPERDNAQFYTDHYLLNVAWTGAKHDELASLVRSLPKALP